MRTENDYVVDYKSEDGSTVTTHYRGVSWWDAPPPRRFHRCWPQTEGWVSYFTFIQRCGCGAIRVDGGRWRDRNSKKRSSA